MTQLHKPKSSVREAQTNNLFSGIWIRWRALTVGELFVCINILLIPVWWVLGIYQFLPLLLLLGIAIYEWLQYGELHLKRPNLPVVALFAFATYQLVKILLNYYAPGRPGLLITVVLPWFCPALLLWYIQSNNIKIRMEVVAWACTVSVVQMFGFWLLLQFVLPENLFMPPRLSTLLGLFTGRDDGYKRIAPYEMSSLKIGELYRLSLFFISAQFFAVVAGFIGLVALEIKNRLWSLLLFLACVFLIALSTARVVWVAFPIVVGLRYLFFYFGKRWGPPVIFALIAVASFTMLSLPPISNLIFGQFTNIAQTVNDLRANSTSARLEIYRQTWNAFQENPVWGHVGKGELISLNSSSQNLVGSHSVILGNLLYENGLVGTVIFTVFWISLFIWFYQTRAERPLTGFCVMIFYTLVSPTLGALYGMPLASLLILLCAAIRRPKPIREYGARQPYYTKLLSSHGR